ncbi:hypothetical protein [Chryseolinea sp. T2]|uniref:hypothetical protein n=1 Tax=Chryseolinea sp. T2 TaxID=3129255 RepID=UPI0030789C0F
MKHTHGLDDLESELRSKRLNKLQHIVEAKHHVRNWLLKFCILPFLFMLLIVAWVLITRPVSSTAVAISVQVSDVSFLTAEENMLGDIDLNNSQGYEGPNGLTRVTTDSSSGKAVQWSFIERSNSSIHLDVLQIPSQAEITLASRVTDELILAVSGTPGSFVRGALKISNSTLVVESDVDIDSLQIVSRDLKIEKSLGHEEFGINVTGVKTLEFPPMKIRKVDFVERSPTKEFVDTSIKGGVIRLLETSGDSIIVRNHDKLSVQFEGNANIKVSKTAKGFAVYVEGIATRLLCGAELIETSPRFNRMPVRVAISYQKYPYFWLIGLTMLPLLMGLFWPKRVRT